ncbi:VOC family protein [Novosphingobium album (ex Hu et al. 2023)]|uniref:VOC family protein n=1 Tax=Novosphingobium album (ex Hu et al. 2023) TaxID=2930093 RepID=A0ABT0B6R5_9SPHN|nr:VOC family protein [Novosphingobium album (ex Hu et al. 2023)]MCJ2180745.1 VOC family protein [Novosphingobium album (ex Hu et al. 2023)]
MPDIDPESSRALEFPDVTPAAFAHAVLRTNKYEAQVRFYKTFLNAVPAFENEFLTFLRYDDEHHRVVIANMPFLSDQPNPPTVGLEHMAYTFATLGELLGNYRRLKAEGINPVWCINHGITTSIYYADHDGTLLETQFDNMSVADADIFMKGPYFAMNPIGVDFDPDLLIERYERGDPMSELVKQGSALPPEDVPPLRPASIPPYDARGALLEV